MKSNINKFLSRPSFFYIAYQGFLFLLAVLIGACFCSVGNHKNWGFWLLISCILMTPYLIFYSFITYCLFKRFKNLNNLFNKYFIIFNTLIFCLYFYYLISSGFEQYAGAAEALWFFAIFTIPYIFITFILFTLLPILIALVKNSNQDLVIENPPYLKNKILLLTTSLGIFLFFALNLYCGYFVIDLLFNNIDFLKNVLSIIM